jgi:hypothetical protein
MGGGAGKKDRIKLNKKRRDKEKCMRGGLEPMAGDDDDSGSDGDGAYSSAEEQERAGYDGVMMAMAGATSTANPLCAATMCLQVEMAHLCCTGAGGDHEIVRDKK